MRAILAVKRSKWERDLVRYGSRDTAKNIYRIQNNTFARVYESHKRQKSFLARLRSAVPGWPLVYREDLDHLDLQEADCIVSFGGDNHFVFVSHVSRDLPIIGINSDPQTSAGALLYLDTESFLSKIAQGAASLRLITENWTRIEGTVAYPDGRRTKIGPALAEISVRSSFADAISRYNLRAGDGDWEEQKSSGLLLATGAGSTGWFRNALPAEYYDEAVFPKDRAQFRFVARETSHRRAYRFRFGSVTEQESLELVSEMEGEITVDSHPELTVDFPPGATVRFIVSPARLAVVRDLLPVDD